MNKAELVSAIAQHSGLTKKDAEIALNAYMEIIQETIKNNQKVVLVGFGTFESKQRKERKCRNPRTKEEIVIPATAVPVFKAGKEFKLKVMGKDIENTESAKPEEKKVETKAKPKKKSSKNNIHT